MAITVDWGSSVINVPQADLTPLGGDVYELDVNAFRLTLKDLEDDEAGMAFPRTHNHNTQVTVGGVTLARVIEIVNGYTVTFQDGQYAVNLVGANNNIPDVTNVNQVSIRAGNTAGLVATITPEEVWSVADREITGTAPGAIEALSFAVGALDAAALSLDAGQEIADRVLARSLGVGADGGRTVQDALRLLRNRVSLLSGLLTVYEEDDATPAWSGAVSTAERDAISVIDPT